MKNKRLCRLSQELGIKATAELPDIDTISLNVNTRIKSAYSAKMHVRKKTMRVLITAAVILSIAGITVIASNMVWHEKLIKYFNNPNEKQIQQSMINSKYPLISQTDNGITVNIIQTISDNHGLYILYEVKGINDISSEDTVSWKNQHLKVNYKDEDKKVGMGGYAYNKILDIGKDECTMLYVRSGTESLQKGEISFKLNTLRKKVISGDIAEFVNIADCSFNFAWYFEAENSEKVWDLRYDMNDGKNTLTKIELSPISAWLTIIGEEMAPCGDITIKLKNAEIIRLTSEDYSISYTPLYGGINMIFVEFNKLIIVDDAESITVNGKTIELKNIKDHTS